MVAIASLSFSPFLTQGQVVQGVTAQGTRIQAITGLAVGLLTETSATGSRSAVAAVSVEDDSVSGPGGSASALSLSIAAVSGSGVDAGLVRAIGTLDQSPAALAALRRRFDAGQIALATEEYLLLRLENPSRASGRTALALAKQLRDAASDFGAATTAAGPPSDPAGSASVGSGTGGVIDDLINQGLSGAGTVSGLAGLGLDSPPATPADGAEAEGTAGPDGDGSADDSAVVTSLAAALADSDPASVSQFANAVGAAAVHYAANALGTPDPSRTAATNSRKALARDRLARAANALTALRAAPPGLKGVRIAVSIADQIAEATEDYAQAVRDAAGDAAPDPGDIAALAQASGAIASSGVGAVAGDSASAVALPDSASSLSAAVDSDPLDSDPLDSGALTADAGAPSGTDPTATATGVAAPKDRFFDLAQQLIKELRQYLKQAVPGLEQSDDPRVRREAHRAQDQVDRDAATVAQATTDATGATAAAATPALAAAVASLPAGAGLNLVT